MIDQLAQLKLSALTLVCLLGAMSPGPSLAVILGIAAQSGARSAAFASWAHAIGVGFWATLSLSGWGYLLARAPEVARWLTLIASLYLIYLAYVVTLSVRSPDQADHSAMIEAAQLSSAAHSSHSARSALAGLMISISNPKLLIFFTTIYPQVLPEQASGLVFLLAILIPTFIDGAWYHLVSSLSAQLGLLDALARHQRRVAYASAALFLLIAMRGLQLSLGLGA